MDDVLGGHDELHVLAGGDVELVDFALTFHVLDLPHPLLGNDINFRGVAGRRALLKIENGSPDEEGEHDAEGDDGPGDFEDSGAFDLVRRDAWPAAIFDGEHCDREEYKCGHHTGDKEEIDVERIDLPRQGRGRIRPQWKIFRHI